MTSRADLTTIYYIHTYYTLPPPTQGQCRAGWRIWVKVNDLSPGCDIILSPRVVLCVCEASSAHRNCQFNRAPRALVATVAASCSFGFSLGPGQREVLLCVWIWLDRRPTAPTVVDATAISLKRHIWIALKSVGVIVSKHPIKAQIVVSRCTIFRAGLPLE